ncbi:MAG: carbohydrate-binding family 9-like protein [Thermoanaerobaculia bacterium]
MPPLAETVRIPFREFDSTEHWNIPEGCPPLVFTQAADGGTPRLATLLHIYRDAEQLYLLFSGVDSAILATMYEHDEPLWQEDVLEAFLSPGSPERYYEIEVNPLGTLLDAAIHSPNGSRESMSVDLGWGCSGMWTSTRRVRRDTTGLWRFETLLVIPFAGLAVEPPGSGDRWRANFFRIDRDAELGDEYSSWRPTMKEPADFHVPAAFGLLEF